MRREGLAWSLTLYWATCTHFNSHVIVQMLIIQLHERVHWYQLNLFIQKLKLPSVNPIDMITQHVYCWKIAYFFFHTFKVSLPIFQAHFMFCYFTLSLFLHVLDNFMITIFANAFLAVHRSLWHVCLFITRSSCESSNLLASARSTVMSSGFFRCLHISLVFLSSRCGNHY